MADFWDYLFLALGLLAASACIGVAVRLLRTDRLERKKSAKRASSIRDAIMGRSRTVDDWIPDARIKAGMIYNKKRKRLEVSGRLSEDSFNRVFH